MNLFLLIFLAVIIGCLMPIQAVVNSGLTRFLSHPVHSSFISFLSGSFVLFFASLFTGKSSISLSDLKNIPPLYFIGGVLGAIFVLFSILAINKLGATALMASFLTGQLIMSVILDHWGLFGLPQIPLSFSRVAGVALLFVGIFLVMKE